jgi:hypothetical protein
MNKLSLLLNPLEKYRFISVKKYFKNEAISKGNLHFILRTED